MINCPKGGLEAVKKTLNICGVVLIAYGLIEFSSPRISVLPITNVIERYLTGLAAIAVGPACLALGALLLLWVHRHWEDKD